MGMAQGRGFPQGGVFKAALDAVIVMSHDGLITDWNPAAERTFGHRAEDVIGRELADVIIPPEFRDRHRAALERYAATEVPTILDQRLELVACRADESRFPVELTVTRVPEHEPPLFAGFIRDISRSQEADAERRELLARERSARAEAERARNRYQFLADVGLAFEHALELDEALATLARVAVPVLADLCIVDFLDEGRVLRPAAAIAATDEAFGDEVARRRREAGPGEVARTVLRTREPIRLEDAAGVAPELDCTSMIGVPLLARERLLGAVTFGRRAPSRAYTAEDLATARELVRRAGLVVDNVRLYDDTRHIATALQASLLPPVLPPMPGARLAGRYRAARPGQELGGDFYDVFPADRGRWVVTIGDVCGKGPEAAALTALARYTIRAAAASGEAAPDRILSVLNDALLRDPSAQGRFLTAACAVFNPRSGTHSITFASGGHPAPLVVRADGRVEWLRARGSALGIFADPMVEVTGLDLKDDDAMVLFTDGLTDAGAPGRTLAERDLAAAVGGAAGGSPGRLVDALERAALDAAAGQARDDIALLALQKAPERRRKPRPDSRPLLRIA